MNDPCGCCEGAALPPPAIYNRPGLDALAYRAGTQAEFFAAMQERLATMPALRDLRTRATDDPAIALLDAWATVADVLTFYQERIANEGYLRTATERRSILELARMIGYALRPGVAASVFFAYTLDANSGPTTVPAGSRAQSIPGPGEKAQSFETSDSLDARPEWNLFTPRRTYPQVLLPYTVSGMVMDRRPVYFQGTATGLKPNDALLFDFGSQQAVYRVTAVTPDPQGRRTGVTFRGWNDPVSPAPALESLGVGPSGHLQDLLDPGRAGLNTEVAPVQKALGLLQPIQTALAQGVAPGRVALEAGTVPALRQELALAGQNRHVALAHWLQGVIDHLQATVQATSPDAMMGVAAEGSSDGSSDGSSSASVPFLALRQFLTPLQLPPSVPPPSSQRLGRSIQTAFKPTSDLVPSLLSVLKPRLGETLYAAWENIPISPATPAKVYALRVAAPLFGHNAPPVPQYEPATIPDGELSRPNPRAGQLLPPPWPEVPFPQDEPTNALSLDNAYPQIVPGDFVVVQKPPHPRDAAGQPQDDSALQIWRSQDVQVRSRSDYGLSGKTTLLGLPDSSHRLLPPPSEANVLPPFPESMNDVRGTTVYTQSELLALADLPITEPVGRTDAGRIELDGLADGLVSGRWVIIQGQRADLGDTVTGVPAAEVAMLAGVEQAAAVSADGKTPLPGDTTHTTLVLAKPLAYTYKRDTVQIFGNVVKATHGQTQQEALGSGSGAPRQRYTLKGKPLTYLSAPTPAGATSTLQVRVNSLLWHECDTLAGLGPTDREYVTQTDNDGTTRILFGDGAAGAIPPTGAENIQATYRSGIGVPGNVGAGQISLLAVRPLGVKTVINPLPATGGADPEGRDQARTNAPRTVMALDRLVSVQDYADFARTYAGIGKAAASRLSDGRRQVVLLSVAGADDIPVDLTSDLYQNLKAALTAYGDPYQPVQVALAKRLLLVIGARVQIGPDYLWDAVSVQIRAALLDGLGFARRDLAQDVVLSEVIRLIQSVDGVSYVDVDTLDAVDEDSTLTDLTNLAISLGLRNRIAAKSASVDPTAIGAARLLPAQIAFLSPRVPDTLILRQWSDATAPKKTVTPDGKP